MPNKPTATDIDHVIQRNLPKLRKPGVLTVRPGYEIANHQLTGKTAVVATVHTKTSDLPKSDLLPDSIEGHPVDVREATPHQRLRAHDPAAAQLTQTYGRMEDREPAWPHEREMPSGKPLDAPQSDTQKSLSLHKANQPATVRALASHSKKPELKYTPAPGASLGTVNTTTTITAHASPDAGLATLEKFLAGTKQSLVVGMYDFTSGTILKAFESALGGSRTLRMVLDNPAPNKTRDQTDSQTVDDLDQVLGGRATIARALVRTDTYAAAWIYPYAYHIKVIVRDGTAFWLSSGNLNNSNQPDLDHPPQTEDRDWHVIIEDQGLAKTFAAFIENDLTVALQNQAAPVSHDALTKAVSDAHAKLAAETNPPPPPPLSAAKKTNYVQPKVFSNVPVTITPLLTPDKLPGSQQGEYLASIVKLVSSAQQKLYIQLQYIEASGGSNASNTSNKDYNDLLQAVADRVAAGVDVRLIESLEYGEKWVEKMKASGVDLTANIHLQSNVHNKGFVVDSKTVVVSSQNFSPAGIDDNRDAGVIIESAEIAEYFETIFLSDWNTKSRPAMASSAKGGAKGKATPKASSKARTGKSSQTRKRPAAKTSKKAVKKAMKSTKKTRR